METNKSTLPVRLLAAKAATHEAQQVLAFIARELDGRDWNADTIDRIASILRDCGYLIRDPYQETDNA